MMFVVRGIAVSLASFVLLYCLLSSLVLCAWRIVLLLRATSQRRSGLLFWLRAAPLIISAAFTLALVVPAYVRLEPRSMHEDIALPLALGFGCLALLGLGIFRVLAAQRKSASVVKAWLKDAETLPSEGNAPVLQTHQHAPPLTLVGVCSPRVVVSETTVGLLSSDELRVAVRHEIAHMRSRDNLKKLVFHCLPFPYMWTLEGTWQEAAEMAADDWAVSSAREALDLAAALIKLSRHMPLQDAPPAFTMALIDVPGPLSVRVQRLLSWSGCHGATTPDRWPYALLPALATLLIALGSYRPALSQIHRVSEWLVR